MSFNPVTWIDDIGLEVDEVEANNIVDYEHPTKRMTDPYGGSYKPDYGLLKECGYMSDISKFSK